LTAKEVVAALDRVVGMDSVPKSITVDNGSEFANRAMDAWAYRQGVQLEFIRAWQARGQSIHRKL